MLSSLLNDLEQEKTSMGKLILLRHGHTVLNMLGPEERLRGWLDVSLSSTGFEQAAEAAGRLADFPVETIYCSDLLRTKQTARAVEQTTKAPVVHTGTLRPWNLGSLCGQRVHDILPTLAQLSANPHLLAPEGESFHDFYKRFSDELWRLLSIAAKSSQSIVGVTHIRNLLAVPTILFGGDWTKIPVHGGPPPGSLVVIEADDEGATVSMDDVVHRQPYGDNRALGMAGG
jgi:broad specificity phosphatase PhoE